MNRKAEASVIRIDSIIYTVNTFGGKVFATDSPLFLPNRCAAGLLSSAVLVRWQTGVRKNGEARARAGWRCGKKVALIGVDIGTAKRFRRKSSQDNVIFCAYHGSRCRKIGFMLCSRKTISLRLFQNIELSSTAMPLDKICRPVNAGASEENRHFLFRWIVEDFLPLRQVFVCS